MYRFQYISDLHLEMGSPIKIPAVAPYLLLAGDIGYPETKEFSTFLQECSRQFETVFYTPGNHEYYQKFKKRSGAPPLSMDVLDTIMKKMCGEFHNVVYLNNATYDIDASVRIIGSTLWSDIDPRAPIINDFDQIYATPDDVISLDDIKHVHTQSVEFLSREIQASPLPTIVMTHHLPSYKMIIPRYKAMPYKAYNCHFASHLDHLFQPPVKAWVCGHSHCYQYQYINNIPCYLNACGYPGESTGAKWDAVIEIDLV
jgi:hypothetical protein